MSSLFFFLSVLLVLVALFFLGLAGQRGKVPPWVWVFLGVALLLATGSALWAASRPT